MSLPDRAHSTITPYLTAAVPAQTGWLGIAEMYVKSRSCTLTKACLRCRVSGTPAQVPIRPQLAGSQRSYTHITLLLHSLFIEISTFS